MSPVWHCCPHCDVYFVPTDGHESMSHCPGCGKALPARSIVAPTALTASIPSTCAPDKGSFDTRHDVLSEAQVVPEAGNCVQCGMCSYNCPMEIDVRAHAWRGIPIRDSHCLTCSECVNRCPRGVLRFERIPLFVLK